MKPRKAQTRPVFPSIIDVLQDRQLFGPLFRGLTWLAWLAFLKTIFALPMSQAEATLVRRCTGRQALLRCQAKEAWVIVGRRGGKSRVAALLAVFLSCFRDYSKILVQGERGTIMLIASDRRQARVLKGYVAGLLHAVPMLDRMIVNETGEAIELDNRVIIEIHTASFKSVRGYTIIAAILDEIAFWPTDESANPDSEIVKALRPAMLTVPGALVTATARRALTEIWWPDMGVPASVSSPDHQQLLASPYGRMILPVKSDVTCAECDSFERRTSRCLLRGFATQPAFPARELYEPKPAEATEPA